MTSVRAGLVTRSPQRLAADPSRVITRLFVPGQEGFERQDSRAGAVLERILALDEDEVRSSLDDVVTRFDGRHRDLVGTFRRHARELADRLDPDSDLSEARMLLLGAAFTSEYAIEGAALCNPSMVAHPDQTRSRGGQPAIRDERAGHRGGAPFVHRVPDRRRRRCGRRHDRRSGSVRHRRSGQCRRCSTRRCSAASSRGLHDAGEAADYVLDALGDRFTRADLDEQLDNLQTHLSTRGHAPETMSLIRTIAERTYAVEFADDSPLSERVLCPAMSAEGGRHGGRTLRPLRRRRRVGHVLCQLHGLQRIPHQPAAARDDGFPVVHLHADGRDVPRPTRAWRCFPAGFAVASLPCRDRTANRIRLPTRIIRSCGRTRSPCQQPARAWEALQLGNCGPPIETEAGWLVLTHGVGPMRTYRIGAILLDLDDPTRILGQLRQPLLSPAADEQDGYVPNVVYSCGALVHAETLVLPYGIADSAIGVATVPLPELLAALGG